MNNNLADKYKEYYKSYKVNNLYPTEFIVRSFLGNYPSLKSIDQDKLIGKKVLDLGFGDGRNIPFLYKMGLDVYGLEISKEIIDLCSKNLKYNNAKANLVLGNNSSTTFPDNFFDFLIACHSCYYINEEESFRDNLNEIRRIMVKNGRFIFSVPSHDSYLLKGANILKDNHAIINNDPKNIRNGSKIKFFSSKNEITFYLNDKFKNFKIGLCKNNWWGIEEFCWIVVCNAKSF